MHGKVLARIIFQKQEVQVHPLACIRQELIMRQSDIMSTYLS